MTSRVQVLLLSMLCAAGGCRSSIGDLDSQDERLKYAAGTSFSGFSVDRVIKVTRETLTALKMQNATSTATGIDAVFRARSAVGRQFKIVVIGTMPKEGRILVYAAHRNDQPQAKLLLAHIKAELQSYGSVAE